MPEDEVIRTGIWLHPGDLDQQWSVTGSVAATDAAELSPILGDEFLETMTKVSAKVALVAKDRTFAEEASQLKTGEQNGTVRKALDWRHTAMSLGKVLVRRGAKQASNLRKITSPDKSFSSLRTEIQDKVALLEKYAPKAPKPDYAKALAAEGAKLAAELQAKDAAQEIDIKNLPKKTREAYYYMGLLYLGMKQIIDIGEDLEDPAGPYDMSIYHRRQELRAAGKAPKAKAVDGKTSQ